MSKLNKPELLAPAGSLEALKASVNSGADAVYMGGKMFGARAYADNPDTDGVLEAMEYCHIRNRKLYLTVNTLLKDEEITSSLYGYLAPLYEAGLDAVIVQDIGVMNFVGEYFPGLDIHVSTQCSLTMAEGADGIRSLVNHPESIKRIVPARELSLDELKVMRKKTDLEMEVFIHGALCYCFSGQCLFSSLAGGRSGNRGRCAQPCRRFYRAEIEENNYSVYLLSPKDMCTLEHIPKMIEAGIDSFKIEGRMKSAEYAAGVVSSYRKIIDSYLENRTSDPLCIENETEKMRELYNRGGFNTGYLFMHKGQDMMSTGRPGHYGVCVGKVVRTDKRKAVIELLKKVDNGDVLEIRNESEKIYEFTCGEKKTEGELIEILTLKQKTASIGMKVYRTKCRSVLDEINSEYIKKESKCAVNMKIYCNEGENLKLTMNTAEFFENAAVEAEVFGQPVQKAVKAASSCEQIKDQLKKLGNTDFIAENTEVYMDDDVFVSVGELNRLRREACGILREKLLDSYKRTLENKEIKANTGKTKYDEYAGNGRGKTCFTAHVSSLKQLSFIIDNDKEKQIEEIYFDMNPDDSDKALEISGNSGKKLFFVLPRILRQDNYDVTLAFCSKYLKYAGFLVSNYEGLNLVKSIGAVYRTDSNLYAFNRYAIRSFMKKSEDIDMHNGINAVLNCGYTLPIELNRQELNCVADVNGEMIVYGLLPVMISAQCIYKTVTGKCCPHPPFNFKDEKGYIFNSVSDCRNCVNTIYNSAVLNLLHRFGEIKNLRCGRFRLEFTFENENEIRNIIFAVKQAVEGKVLNLPDGIMDLKYTNGHFMRGVE